MARLRFAWNRERITAASGRYVDALGGLRGETGGGLDALQRGLGGKVARAANLVRKRVLHRGECVGTAVQVLLRLLAMKLAPHLVHFPVRILALERELAGFGDRHRMQDSSPGHAAETLLTFR